MERDYTKNNRKFRSLSTLEALNERVLAYMARNVDIVTEAERRLGKNPGLNDVFRDIINLYEEASSKYYVPKRKHYEWGFFRSFWPAAILMNRKLDRNDPDTRSWLYVFGIIAIGCIVVVFCSVCFFVASIWRNLILGAQYEKVSIGAIDLVTETGLAVLVLLAHGLTVLHFLNKTITGMFYFSIDYKRNRSRRTEVDVSGL